MSNKYIYEFNVQIEREVPKAETTTVDGVTTTVTTVVKEKTPHYFAFKKPSRAEREDAEAERASAWYKFVEKGLIPEAILLKTYDNAGGILSENQRREYREMRVTALLTLQEHQHAIVDKDAEKAKALMSDFMKLRDAIVAFEREQSSFFENTAEAKARTKLIEWLILHMTFHREKLEDQYALYFDGADLPAKYDQLEQREDSNDPLYAAARERLAFVASYFVAMNGELTKEQIDEYAKENGLLEPAVSAQPA